MLFASFYKMLFTNSKNVIIFANIFANTSFAKFVYKSKKSSGHFTKSLRFQKLFIIWKITVFSILFLFLKNIHVFIKLFVMSKNVCVFNFVLIFPKIFCDSKKLFGFPQNLKSVLNYVNNFINYFKKGSTASSYKVV